MLKKLIVTFGLSLVLTVLVFCIIRMEIMFITGLNPFMGWIFLFVVVAITVPLLSKGSTRFSNYFKDKISFTPAVLFAMGCFSFLSSGFFSEVFLGNSTLDIHLHDTYYIIAYAHIAFFNAILFGIFSVIYHFYSRLFGRYINTPLGYIHFWITLVGAYLISWSTHYYEEVAGMPLRYIDYGSWSPYVMSRQFNMFLGKVGVVLCAAQILFLINLTYSAISGKKLNA